MKIDFSDFLGIFILVAAIILLSLAVYGIFIDYTNEEVIAIEVKDKYIKRQGTGDKIRDVYMIVDSDNNTYQITDLLFKGKFNSTDLYNTFQIGQVYLVEVSGIRNHFFSMYRNINKIVE